MFWKTDRKIDATEVWERMNHRTRKIALKYENDKGLTDGFLWGLRDNYSRRFEPMTVGADFDSAVSRVRFEVDDYYGVDPELLTMWWLRDVE